MEEAPVPGPTPRPDPTSGSSYGRSFDQPLREPGTLDEVPLSMSEETKNQEAQSQKPPAPSGNPT